MIHRSPYFARLNDLTIALGHFKKSFKLFREFAHHFWFGARFLFFWATRFFLGGWKKDLLFTAPHRLFVRVSSFDSEKLAHWFRLSHHRIWRAYLGQLKPGDRVWMTLEEFCVDRNDFDRSKWKWARSETFWGGNDPTSFRVEKVGKDCAEIVSLNGTRFVCPIRCLYQEF